MSRPLLEVDGVCRTFGKVRAVDDVSFTMERGSIWGFIGPNGAGKTTTMRILATLELPDQGDAFVEGVSVLVDPRAVRMRIGFMSDQFAPYSNLDVAQFLDFFARAYGCTGRTRVERVRAVADFCGLGTFLERPVTGLSKGMGQRVHLAKTLLHDPALLILDEPASGLDPRARIEFRDLLRALAASGKGILISSHILAELSEICDGAIVLERGRKVAGGSLEAIVGSMRSHRTVSVRTVDADVATAAERFFLLQPLVRDVRVEGTSVRFELESGSDEALADLLARAVGQGLRIAEFRQDEADLEDIFMHTTKGALQ